MTTEPAGMSIDVPGALDSFSADQLGDIDRIEEITGSPKKPISNNETEAVATEGTVAGLATNNDYVSQETGTVVRARLFCLSEEETWEDLTTGIFVLENDYSTGFQYFRLLSEQNPEECLFEAAVKNTVAVTLQNDSVLSWKPDDGRDLALSFEYAGCMSEVWHKVCEFQRRPPEYEYFGGIAKITLPEVVDPTSIPVIESSLSQYLVFHSLRGPLGDMILEENYIPQFLDQFKLAGNANDTELQVKIFQIFRMFAMMNHRAVFDELTSASIVEFVAEVFEADPNLATTPDYHSFFQDQAKVKTIVAFNNPKLETLIGQAIRTQYFKDVILPRYLDDEGYSWLTLLTRSYLSDIALLFDSNGDYYRQLSELFKSDSYSVNLEALKFCKEFISVCRASNLRSFSFFRSGIFSEFVLFVQRILADMNNTAAPLAAELLLTVSQIECQQVRTLMRDQQSLPPAQQLFGVLIDRFHRDEDVGTRWHLVTIFRLILDPPLPTGINAQAVAPFEEFNDYFYAQHALKFLSPFSSVDKTLQEHRLTESEADRYYHLCELVSSFILLHKYKIKYMLVRDHILPGICSLMKCHLAYIKLASLRLFRTLLSVKDDFYTRIMLSSHMFDYLFEALRTCMLRNNLLRAAVLDFFVALHDSKCKKLIDELVPKFRKQMEDYGHMHEVFLRIINLYDSNYLEESMEASQTEAASVSQEKTPLPGDNWGTVDATEEDYFSSATEEDDKMVENEPEAPQTSESPELSDLPPITKKADKEGEDDEFGGALSGKDSPAKLQPQRKLSSFLGSSLIKKGLNLFKSSSNNNTDSAVPDPGSPTKKAKH